MARVIHSAGSCHNGNSDEADRLNREIERMVSPIAPRSGEVVHSSLNEMRRDYEQKLNKLQAENKKLKEIMIGCGIGLEAALGHEGIDIPCAERLVKKFRDYMDDEEAALEGGKHE